MRDTARLAHQEARSSPPRGRREAAAVSPAAKAFALRRVAGKRVTARMLARWVKHPDAEQKGVMIPDVVPTEFVRFNPPKHA
jgi:hypothetical protein